MTRISPTEFADLTAWIRVRWPNTRHSTYSIIDDDPDGGYRLARCTRCGHEWSAVAARLLTDAEKAASPLPHPDRTPFDGGDL